jgi:hypothetical protein
MGVDVLELASTQPYTAARGRNAGWLYLLHEYSDLQYVQFVDGDCIICDGWTESGCAAIEARPEAAVVCGRVRERYPHISVYNRICELEWKQPVGEIEHCGGNILVRVSALRKVGGFNPEIIAAEDTELCTRLRLQGWKIVSLDADMVLHDAAMLYLHQWFRRAVRAGHAMTDGAARHGRSSARLFVRASRRVAIYGWVLPLLIAMSTWPTRGWSLMLLCAYPLLAVKTYAGRRRMGEAVGDAAIYAAHCVLAKFPQALGQIIYYVNQLRGRHTRLIEHKRPSVLAGATQQIGGRQT